jgi:hypothetical protein
MLGISAYSRNVEKLSSEPWQWSVVTALGITQIFAWGCTDDRNTVRGSWLLTQVFASRNSREQ